MLLELRSVVDRVLAAPDRSARGALPPIRLSQNEMPWAPADMIVSAMTEAVRNVHRYPDYHRSAARAAVAGAMGLDPGRIAIDNGSGSLLHALARLVCEPGVHGVRPAPSFEAYAAALSLAGAESTEVGLDENGAMDLDAMLAAVGPDTRIVYLCNPNNPTGGMRSVEDIRNFLQRVPASVLVVVDEAYREFVSVEPVDATVGLLDEFENLVLLRTLSKAHGLAGIRVGYAAAAPRIAEALRRTSVGFALNSVAEAAVIAAFGPAGLAVAQERVSVIVSERARVEAALKAGNVSYVPSQANFLFLHGDAADLLSRLEARGVLARPFPRGGGVRVTIGLPEENDAVLGALL
ncbi:pyridoxal phosphate-dependent aminotransferase [Amycolatopsis taiwanensis]|uniref:Phenylalanine aminotransferase n=1 Tax=Amycolatopsis taiwanensis TaxID=342230 RepID=A0A9W6VJX0_9PSEU|nr:aminotransferase class I/II-fold pyridoxal phosphate-dependent enzyme [Amycolatopsis taiwanensis]GLY68946.1 putative phenylalanine aminotransferase [Amycolatopsis taiwanensis]